MTLLRNLRESVPCDRSVDCDQAVIGPNPGVSSRLANPVVGSMTNRVCVVWTWLRVPLTASSESAMTNPGVRPFSVAILSVRSAVATQLPGGCRSLGVDRLVRRQSSVCNYCELAVHYPCHAR